ncbi:hypothetical protein VTI74DRAFT_6876 [Chaetomium olivicolor]
MISRTLSFSLPFISNLKLPLPLSCLNVLEFSQYNIGEITGLTDLRQIKTSNSQVKSCHGHLEAAKTFYQCNFIASPREPILQTPNSSSILASAVRNLYRANQPLHQCPQLLISMP